MASSLLVGELTKCWEINYKENFHFIFILLGELYHIVYMSDKARSMRNCQMLFHNRFSFIQHTSTKSRGMIRIYKLTFFKISKKSFSSQKYDFSILLDKSINPRYCFLQSSHLKILIIFRILFFTLNFWEWKSEKTQF